MTSIFSSFTYPWVLSLLTVPVILALLLTWHRGRHVVLPFDHAVEPTGAWNRFTAQFSWLFVSFFDRVLPLLLLAVVIVILAGPQQLGEPKSKKALTNIEFCVDVSGSMTAKFGEGTRYDASMAAIEEFLDFREGDAFGLTFFGNEVLHWVPLTNDVTAIRCAPPFMNPKNPGHPPWLGGTAIGKALVACHKVLTEREEGDRMIILVSDGSSFDLRNGSDIEIAKKLIADNIVVYGIHISSGGVPDPIVNITHLTGGEVFNPGEPESLQAVFTRIDEMQETKLEKVSAETMDWFAPFAVVGLGLGGLMLIGTLGLRYTPW